MVFIKNLMNELGLMSYELNCIIAQSNNNVIGNNNEIPWHLPNDLRQFRLLTLHNIVVMGRKTYESLPVKKLNKRINIVITTTPEKYTNEEDLFFCKKGDALSLCKSIWQETDKKIFIIGGSDIYRMFLNDYHKLYITHVDMNVKGNVKSPFTEKCLETYKITYTSEVQNESNIDYTFKTYEKNFLL